MNVNIWILLKGKFLKCMFLLLNAPVRIRTHLSCCEYVCWPLLLTPTESFNEDTRRSWWMFTSTTWRPRWGPGDILCNLASTVTPTVNHTHTHCKCSVQHLPTCKSPLLPPLSTFFFPKYKCLCVINYFMTVELKKSRDREEDWSN